MNASPVLTTREPTRSPGPGRRPFGRRIAKTVGKRPAKHTPSVGFAWRWQDWCGLERNSGGRRCGGLPAVGQEVGQAVGRVGGDADHPLKQVVWDIRYIDAPVVRFHDGDTNGTIDDTLYYTTDANMNVTALVDTSGTVLERVAYDSYGNPTFYDGSWTTPAATSSYDNVVLYCGYRWDGETGLYHVRHRSYHPTLGRWLQRDPIGYADGMGLYEYGASSPAVAQDPMGLSWEVNPDRIKFPGDDPQAAAKARNAAVARAFEEAKTAAKKAAQEVHDAYNLALCRHGIVCYTLYDALESQFRDAARENGRLAEGWDATTGMPASSGDLYIDALMMLLGPAAKADAIVYDSLADNCKVMKGLACDMWIEPFCCPETAQDYCSK